MPFVNVGKENSGEIDLYYEDHGTGKPVVLIHGWPLSGATWEKQESALLKAGFRVIAYDRRGFGTSSRPTFGYDYDTFADDLHKLIQKLDLKDVTLVGFSMGGGEVARYLGKYGTRHISRAVFISAVTPFLLKTNDNPEGVDGQIFEGVKFAIGQDRPAFLAKFLSDFYNVDVLVGKQISERVIQANWNVAVGASPTGTIECVTAFGTTDFRNDLAKIDIPVLAIHGDSDRIVPIGASASRLPMIVKGCKLVTVDGGPHGIIWTHSERVNKELLDFLKPLQEKAERMVAH